MRIAALSLAASALLGACLTRDRMCVTWNECGPSSVCVAGRCQPQKGTPAISQATDGGAAAVRRVVFAAADVAFLSSEPEAASPLPSVVALGKHPSDELLLRFEARIPEGATVVEAYLLLPVADGADVDPAPVSLHARRVLDPWDSRSVRWSTQPRTLDVGAPATWATSAGRPVIRLDVRELVARWPRREKDEQGVAVVAAQTSATGIPVALSGSLALEAYLKD